MTRNRMMLIGVIIVAAAAFWWTNQPKEVADGEPIVSVMVPELNAAAKRGEKLFNVNCAACHGPNASGKDGFAPPLIHVIYEPNHHADISFQLAVKNGVRGHHWPFGNMPPIEGVGELDVVQIVNYIRTLQRANGIK
ncbi:MAG: cytochrome C [Hyphomicrobiales bacterium]|nr:c-type cytochrome [Hyphomicrobiales bacterium]PCJ93300.1 MAG: cytochrome C [Hyphomicrobiales bacterium]